MNLAFQKITKEKKEELRGKFPNLKFVYSQWVTNEEESVFMIQEGGKGYDSENRIEFVVFYRGECHYFDGYSTGTSNMNGSVMVATSMWHVRKMKGVWDDELEQLIENMLCIWTRGISWTAEWKSIDVVWEN